MKLLPQGEVGARIRRARSLLGLTQEQFAERIEISPQFLTEIETGKKGMSAETLYRICTTFHLSADYILLGRTAPETLSHSIQSALDNLPGPYRTMTQEILTAIEKAAKE